LTVDFKLMDPSGNTRLLIRGDMRSRPLKSVADANFPPEIHQALDKMDMKSPLRIQTCAWPAIMRGQYTVLVGPHHSGKTLSYIVPVVSFMLTPDMYSELPPGNGPLVLVLCSGSRSAEFVFKKCCSLLKYARQTEVRVQLALGGMCEIDLRDKLANGCDILISTPCCFLRLFRCSSLITNLNRVAHLILDEVDILADKFLPEVKKILTECKFILKQRTKVAIPIQLIAASEKWCPAVEQFSQNISQEFVIIISGYLEAAVYAQLQPTLHYLYDEYKVQTLLDILDENRGLYKTLVVCKNAKEVESLKEVLLSQCYHVITAHENKPVNKETLFWNNCISGRYPVLVCSDDVLPELNINDTLWLIHYSLPSTKTKFGFRFSSLMVNYRDLFCKSSADGNVPDCKVHIFVDKNENSKELPEVVRFMKRLSLRVHPEIASRAAEYTKHQEEQKSSAPLCYYIKAFGECLEKANCPNRHVVVSSLDDSANIPRCGTVKLKILHVLDASRFTARLLLYKDENGKTVHTSDDYFVIGVAVLKYYSIEQNRYLHGLPKVGDICGLETKINAFQRVQVVEIIKQDEKNIPEEVQVCLLDEGIYKMVKVYQLLSLPEHLQKLPRQTVEVFLCNVCPCDLDTCWSQEACYKMSSWIHAISEGETQGKFVVGKIVLSLGNTLWLDPLKCCSHLGTLDAHVTEVSLRSELLKSQLAVDNPKHVKNLLKMCRQAQMQIETDKSVEIQEKEVVVPSTPQWAFLSLDDYQSVVFVYATDPYEFFVRRYDFDKCFHELVAEIQEYIKTKPQGFQVEKGALCLGKFPEDGVWYRARVNEILEDKLVSLFFVDHGDFASVSIDDIAPITNKLINKLPFQAIECSLFGVKPTDGDIWCEDAIDIFYDFEDSFSYHVKVCEVLEQGRCTDGKKYQVLCVVTDTQQKIVLNDILVEKKLAVSDNMNLIREEVDIKPVDSDDEIEIEEKSHVVKLSDVCKEIKPSDLEPSIESEDEEEYDVVMDSTDEFIKRMLGLNKLAQIVSPPSVATTSLPALPAPDTTLNHISTISSVSSDCITAEERIPPLASYVKTPNVLWYQDYYTIGINIKLTGVNQYYFTWCTNHINFSAEVNGDNYEVADELFGAIIPSETIHSAKGLNVHIKMKKAFCGFKWPRLFSSKHKKLWLKYDFNMFKEDSRIFMQGDNRRFLGLDRKEWEGAEIVPELDETDDEDEKDDDDNYDFIETMDSPYDYFDP
ncbi:hypothetical protein L9F63_017706, partial [Diploptera punctata]